MSEKNISPQPAEPKKGQKNTRRYTRKPKQNKGTDALSQAVQSAIEFVKEPLSPRGKKAQAEEKKPQKKNNQKQAEKPEPMVMWTSPSQDPANRLKRAWYSPTLTAAVEQRLPPAATWLKISWGVMVRPSV